MKDLIHGEILARVTLPTVHKGPLRLGGLRCDDTATWDSLVPSTDIIAFEQDEIVIRKDGQVISIYVRDRQT